MKLFQICRFFALAALFVTLTRAANKELNLYAWSEYIPQVVLDGFSKETGIKVNYHTFASGEEMLAKLLAGDTRYDLVQPPDYIAEALIQNKLLVPLDYKKLTNFKNLLPEFTGMPHDPAQKFTVPYMSGTVGIVINTERVKDPVAGYRDLFSDTYKNRIVVLDDGRELVIGALYTLGIGLNDITPTNLQKVRPVLSGWFKNIKLFDSDSPKTALLNGDVDLGLVWSGEAAILWNENNKFHYVLPAEGAHMFVDVLAIPKGSGNPDAAHRFIDYILRPDVSALISEGFPYTNPNGEARKLLKPEQLANPASYPKTSRKLDTLRYLGENAGTLIDELFTDLKKRG
jgi:spermidine/putrescine-binding protein